MVVIVVVVVVVLVEDCDKDSGEDEEELIFDPEVLEAEIGAKGRIDGLIGSGVLSWINWLPGKQTGLVSDAEFATYGIAM